MGRQVLPFHPDPAAQIEGQSLVWSTIGAGSADSAKGRKNESHLSLHGLKGARSKKPRVGGKVCNIISRWVYTGQVYNIILVGIIFAISPALQIDPQPSSGYNGIGVPRSLLTLQPATLARLLG